MARTPELVEFRPEDTSTVAGIEQAMAELTTAKRGWINLYPGIHPDDEPPAPSILGSLFSGTGPPVPVCTWVAPQAAQKPPHAELGILHKSGPKAVQTLAADGITVPDTWRVLADHPKRGLVIAVHPESSHREVLDWLLQAGAALTRIPLTGSWQAAINR
jgi:hypothetical protein